MGQKRAPKGSRPGGEISGFILLLFALFLLISLFSYHRQKNYCGKVGSFLSLNFIRAFGIFAYLFVFFFFLFGLTYLLRRPKKPSLLLAIKVFLIAFFLNSLFGYLGLPLELSGLSGQFFGSIFARLFGSVGGLIILPGLLILLLLIFTGIKIPVEASFQFLGRFINFGAKSLSRLLKKRKKKSERLPKNETASTATPTEILTPTPALPKSEGEKIPPGEEIGEEREDNFSQEFISSLVKDKEEEVLKNEEELKEEARLLLAKLGEFEITGEITGVLTGPVITRFEFEPSPGIKIQKIESLADDLALSLKAEKIRVLAPIPGKAAVGIEIPNKRRQIVRLRPILETGILDSSPSPITFVLGKTITGEPYIADLREMLHILIAGTTGSGKSACINCILSSIIYRSSYRDVRFLTIDPKRLELPIYDPIPHLLGPTTTEPQAALKELDRIIQVMEMRYSDFARLGVRDIESYNEKCLELGREKKPYIVVIVDELADLMKTVKDPKEMERRITRLAQMSRAVGIHLILATQRPSVDAIAGLIKANFPCRIAFQVASKTDSRTILDMNGAESLLGKGDMLFLPPGKGEPIRLHGAFISVEETKRLVGLWAKRYLREILSGLTRGAERKARELVESGVFDILINKEKASIEEERKRLDEILTEEIAEKILSLEYHLPLEEELALEKLKKKEVSLSEGIDEYFAEAARFVFQNKEASVSMLQRKLDVGWARAGRIIDQLERAGIVGPYAGPKSRMVLIETEEELESLLAKVLKRR